MLSVADREAIENLVRSADQAATRRDDAAYAALYTPDGIMQGSKGNAEGREAIRAAVRAVWAAEPAGSQHLTRDIRIDEEAGESWPTRGWSSLCQKPQPPSRRLP